MRWRIDLYEHSPSRSNVWSGFSNMSSKISASVGSVLTPTSERNALYLICLKSFSVRTSFASSDFFSLVKKICAGGRNSILPLVRQGMKAFFAKPINSLFSKSL